MGFGNVFKEDNLSVRPEGGEDVRNTDICRKSMTSRWVANAKNPEVREGLPCFQLVTKRPVYLDCIFF